MLPVTDATSETNKLLNPSRSASSSIISPVEDLYSFVKAGKDMVFELEKDDFGERQIQEFFNELIKKRIF